MEKKISEKKRQHYVPRFYLKRFADVENKFYVFDFEQNQMLCDKPIPCESQCYKKYFYGKDGNLEDLLSKKEGEWSYLVDKIFKQDTLTSDDIDSLKEFIIFQKQRTLYESNHTIEHKEATIREYVKTVYYYNNWDFDDEADNYCKQKALEESSSGENVMMASEMLKYVDDLDVLIVHYNTTNKLITSDSPVITLNPFMKFTGFGYDCIGVGFLMPLSPEYLIIMYDSVLYPKYQGVTYSESFDEDEVVVVNKYELIHADQKVFYSKMDVLDLIDHNLLEHRIKENKRNKTSFLGPENMPGRLILSQCSGTNNYYELQYLKLPREFKRIPYECREAIPRHFQEGWERKLEMKYQVLSLFREKRIKEDIGEVIIPKGDLRLGCKRMENLGKQYWRQKGYKIAN